MEGCHRVFSQSIHFIFSHILTSDKLGEAVDEDPAGCLRWISKKKRSNQLKYKEKK